MSTGAGFSSILKLTDLDDFISPGLECIKPMEKPKAAPQPSGSKIRVEIEDDGTYSQIKEGKKETLEKVTVTLNDCLACSGCITSAESVLISQQSSEELQRILELNKTSKDSKAVVSLSAQAVLSIANKYNLPSQETAERLAGMFSELGADHTTVITVAEDLCLFESFKEFESAIETGTSPILTGVCPGWVCYAEKLHPHALPRISRVKSPQQIMGSLIKLIYGKRLNNIAPDQIYHVTLMPCFDRKLEASRTSFFLEEYRTKEVDVVITPIEVEQLFESVGKTLVDFPREELVDFFAQGDNMGKPLNGFKMQGHQGSGSGGFADYVMKRMAEKLGRPIDGEIEWKVGRNPDIEEATLEREGNEKPLRFCVATGFRNIQTLVRKLKTNKTGMPHFVEIMACPMGCLNGGAQVRPVEVDKATQSRDLASKLEKEYQNLPQELKNSGKGDSSSSVSQQVYEMLLVEDSNKELFNHVMYTEFHAVEKTNLGMKW